MAEISLQEYYERIEDIVEQGRYMEAVAHGKHVLRQYPKHVATYQVLGRAMLEAGQDEYAVDMFRRVLSADPENLTAWVGMSEIHNRRDELDASVWHLERAFELAVDNKVVEEELRQLYSRRDGVELNRVQLTRGALARLYLKGDLLSRAIGEFRALLAEHPERVDLAVALAEALWRAEQRLEASEVCQQVLDKLPHCLKANLILGEIWTSSGREEGEGYLRRAEALDPENRMAQELFGDASPLLAREVQITPLEYKPPTEEERPAWLAEVEAVSAEVAPLTEREAKLVDIAAALEAQIEIPAWLEEIDVGEAPAPVTPIPAVPSEELPPEGPTPAPEVPIPEWLADVREGLVEEEPEAAVEEEALRQAAELGPEPISAEVGERSEIPEWLSELGVEPAFEGEIPAAPGEEEVPEWLADLGVEPTGEREAVGEEEEPSVSPEEQPPDWLAGLREQFTGEVQAAEEVPEAAPEEAPTPAEAEGALPVWLEGEEMPSGEEALAWLEQLAAGKEEELRAQVAAEAEVRMAEIMGRPKPAEIPVEEPEVEEPTPEMPTPAPAEIPDWVQELAPPEAAAVEAAAPEEAAVPSAEEGFGWTAFGEPGAPPEAVIPPVEEAAVVVEEIPPTEAGPPEAPVPAWLEGEEMPSGEEALAWLEQLAEGKEEELRAQVAAEAEVRMAEIMGRPEPAERPPEEVVEEEAVVPPVEEAVAPPVEEAFGWTAFGEPEAAPEVIEAVEEAAPVEEVAPPEVPEWARLEEVEAPPVVGPPAPEVAPVIEEEARWGAMLEIPPEEEIAPVPVVEEVPELVEEAVAPPEAMPTEMPLEPETFAAERAYLKEHRRDYEAWLALARALWQADEREEALGAYSRVIRAGKFLETVIPELEEYLEQWPDVATRRVLGDAYMKDGRLQDALEAYRQALETM